MLNNFHACTFSSNFLRAPLERMYSLSYDITKIVPELEKVLLFFLTFSLTHLTHFLTARFITIDFPLLELCGCNFFVMNAK